MDHGWLRILGSGCDRLPRSVADWNKGRTFAEYGDPAPYWLVADDVIGGFFALDGGCLGGTVGRMFYFAPDSLRWEPMDMGYSDFVWWCFTGDTAKYYADYRWQGWEQDVKGLPRATDYFRRWFISVGKAWIEERIELLAGRVCDSPSRIEVRDLGFRWGSCGKKRVAYFNWKMLQLPVRLADYVLVHELSHLVEPHHGPEFSRLLDRSLPDWREREQELQVKAADIYWCGTIME